MSESFDSARDCKLHFFSATPGESSLILMRSRLSALARRLGVSELKKENMLLVASELVSNTVKHAEGRGMVQLWQQPGGVLDMVSLDYGPGINNLENAEVDGFSTASTLGKGLGAIRRLSDESCFYSQPHRPGKTRKWNGTVAMARFYLNGDKHAQRRGARFGLYSRSLSDKRHNGDRIYLHRDGSSLRWLHLDGLGHGEEAEAATADLALHIGNHESPESILKAVDHQVTSTRGAVAIAGELETSRGELRLSGVGDMHAHLYDQTLMQNFAFAPGILGREHRTVSTMNFGFGRHSVIVTASDGIRRNWTTDDFAGLFNKHPQLIAYTLGNIMGRISDDQSVCVISMS